MKQEFKVLGLSAPKSFTCQALEKEDLFWATCDWPDERYKALFEWAKGQEDFWKQNIVAVIEFDDYGVNKSAIGGKVLELKIS